MNDSNAKQQIVDRIKKATNILVTVGKNPSVDELSSALALTLMLNKLDKHTTAVFSGAIPPAIEFLEPTKTFENTVDSLRDFIIALDKEKADRLRYRVEDDVVRIFITPYRTRISEEDLKFTHGDFNVELVLALGVEKQEELDDAIAAHGKILHDATVATFSTATSKSSLGSIDWQDTNASSLCEMLVAMSESLKNGLLDEQISTALLTGIVAATDRFSNSQTSPKSMTMAAQLMAAGANQQLIASKLEESAEISSEPVVTEAQTQAPDGSIPLDEGDSKKIRDKKENALPPISQDSKESLGEITIEHDAAEQVKTVETGPQQETTTKPPQEPVKPPFIPSATIEEHEKRHKIVSGEEALGEALAELDGGGNSAVADTQDADINEELMRLTEPTPTPEPELAYIETGTDTDLIGDAKSTDTWDNNKVQEPSMGGSLSATSQEAEDARRREEESSRNRVIMSHGAPHPPEGKKIEPPASSENANHPSTISEIELQAKNLSASNDHPDVVRKEIDNIFESSEPPSPLPDIQTLSPPAPQPSLLPPPPPLPDFSNLPPLPPNMTAGIPPIPGASSLDILPSAPTAPAPVAPVTNPNDPGQFHIPGQ